MHPRLEYIKETYRKEYIILKAYFNEGKCYTYAPYFDGYAPSRNSVAIQQLCADGYLTMVSEHDKDTLTTECQLTDNGIIYAKQLKKSLIKIVFFTLSQLLCKAS